MPIRTERRQLTNLARVSRREMQKIRREIRLAIMRDGWDSALEWENSRRFVVGGQRLGKSTDDRAALRDVMAYLGLPNRDRALFRKGWNAQRDGQARP